MKLYYTPGACSLASHITTRELGLDIEMVRVDLAEHKTETGDDYYKINPKGYVPFLQINESEYLSEGVAILQYLADQKPELKMSRQAGTTEAYKLQECLTFISSEIHKTFSLFFAMNNLSEEGVANMKARLQKRFALLNTQLANREYLIGDTFTIADAYVFTILNWRHMFNIDIAEHTNLVNYLSKIEARDSVKTAMVEEGLRA